MPWDAAPTCLHVELFQRTVAREWHFTTKVWGCLCHPVPRRRNICLPHFWCLNNTRVILISPPNSSSGLQLTTMRSIQLWHPFSLPVNRVNIVQFLFLLEVQYSFALFHVNGVSFEGWCERGTEIPRAPLCEFPLAGHTWSEHRSLF